MPVRIMILLLVTLIIILISLAGGAIVGGVLPEGADYRQLIAENFDVFLTFNDQTRRARFSVEISDDDLLENIEDFILELRFDPFLQTPLSGVILEPGVATVYIQDDDSKYISLNCVQ